MSTAPSLSSFEIIVNNNLPRTKRILKYYPNLKKYTDLKQKLEIFNPGNSAAIIIYPGKSSKDSTGIKRSKTFQALLNKFNSTIIIVHWPNYAYIPEFSSAQIEDYCISNRITTINIVGTSYGGYCALELIADIKRNKLPIQVAKLITLVTPFSFNEIRFITKLKIQATRIYGDFLKYSHLKHHIFKKNKKYLFRKGSLIGSPFKKDEIIDTTKILAITTKGIDVFVNNHKSAERFKIIFPQLEILQVKGCSFYKGYNKLLSKMVNIQGAHLIARESIQDVQDKIIQFFMN